ncbi:MAG: glycosyltransferase, partial [Rubricoccaceae bacterium]|nr:glycosyltransferase [Rubricoccaceae bacterium]
MLITVGITAYRRLQYLEKAVESVLRQDFASFEVLISQNPHSDREVTESIARLCREVAERNSRVRFRSNKENIGVAENINAIADDAHGDFLFLLGDDDLLLPNGLSSLARYVGPNTD